MTGQGRQREKGDYACRPPDVETEEGGDVKDWEASERRPAPEDSETSEWRCGVGSGAGEAFSSVRSVGYVCDCARELE